MILEKFVHDSKSKVVIEIIWNVSNSVYYKVTMILQCDIIRKNIERHETKMEGVRERHLPKTDNSVIRPTGEHI